MRAPRDFFAHPSPILAQRLLGSTLVRITDSGARLSGVIVETEAYLGPDDACAHSFKNRRTPRTEPMFAQAGTAYIYFTYGMHHCMNVVAGEIDQPQAVLIRALEPTEGLDQMRDRRSTRPGGGGFQPPRETAHRGGKAPPPPNTRKRARPLRDTDLCSGPGKICQALGLDRTLSGIDLVTHDRVFVEPAPTGPIDPADIINDARVGVGDASEWALRPLRWHTAGSPHVSVVRTP